LLRPGGTAAGRETVCPGLHVLRPGFPHPFPPPRRAGEDEGGGQNSEFSVVWWDPRALKLGAEAPLGIRRPELIVKDVAPDVVESGLVAYNSWRERRQRALDMGSQNSVSVQTVTQAAKTASEQLTDSKLPSVEIVKLPRGAKRPAGARFGALVHAVLASAPLGGDLSAIQNIAKIHGRILGASQQEIESASEVGRAALTHPLLNQARDASERGRCRRETPVAWRDADGSLIEGIVDLAFEQGQEWTIIDFKTDEELGGNESAYRRQVGMYAAAIQAANGATVSAVLMQV